MSWLDTVFSYWSLTEVTERRQRAAVKRVWEGKEVNAMLQRLNRLTQDEPRTTAVQILEVVYCLVQNITVIVDGEPKFSGLSSAH